MEFETIDLDVDGAVATITLDRPEKFNAINPLMRDEIEQVLDEFRASRVVRVIRVRGAGRGFCSGYDMASGSSVYASAAPNDAPRAEMDGDVGLPDLEPSALVADRERLRESIERWLRIWSYPKPIIAQVHGMCLSGGLDVIGVCDLVFAGDDAQFGHPAARGLGIPPTLGMLPMRIGLSQTKSLLFTGDLIDSARARAVGLVDEVVTADELDQHVLSYCQRVALNGADALALHKGVVNRWAEIMGIRTGALEGADFDAMFHVTAASRQFGAIAARDGMRAALDWRDRPYR